MNEQRIGGVKFDYGIIRIELGGVRYDYGIIDIELGDGIGRVRSSNGLAGNG